MFRVPPKQTVESVAETCLYPLFRKINIHRLDVEIYLKPLPYISDQSSPYLTLLKIAIKCQVCLHLVQLFIQLALA
jgi:hypothetical protein